MKLLVLGATGATGKQVVDQALASGHQVTVYVRQASKVGPAREGLNVVEGSLQDSTKLGDSIRGQDAVLCTLGHTRLADPTPLLAPALTLVLKCMATHAVKRLVYMSAYGTHETAQDLPFLFGRIIKPLLLRNTYADHEATEAIIQKSGVDWTLVRPVGLNNGPRTGTYQAAERLSGKASFGISRADVADLMLKAAAEGLWMRKAVGQAYDK